jgi:N-acetylmuramoyl-L-alanine amidase
MWGFGPIRVAVGAAALLCAGAWAGPPNHTTKPAAVVTAWDQACRTRAAFEAQAAGTRTKAGYKQVLDAFRAIYHDNPRDRHAADAVFAVAEVLADQGRELEDEKSLRAAVGQYEFLRTQYPASALREPALLAEARIERDDLSDEKAAKEKYGLLLKEAPRSDAAKLARADLSAVVPTHRDEAAMNVASKLSVPVEKSVPQGLKPRSAGEGDGTAEAMPLTRPGAAAVAVKENPAKTKPLAQVTGIRHWSTATYTRVAIDLGDEVKFEAARVPNPDRIYFDLHGARLAQELVGKSFNVTDDGFLKRIRAAQASGDVTRVVLDVSDVTEYSAFLLPNPYRLIIDIHGKKDREEGSGKREEKAAPVVEVPAAAASTASAAANVSGLPPMAPTDGGEAVRPVASSAASNEDGRASLDAHLSRDETATKMGHPAVVPGAVAKPATAVEVAAVSSSPGKVEATSAPTSKPIVAMVPAPKDVTLGTRASRAKTVASDAAATPAKAAEKTAEGETSLIRALGLKINRIVIDAGHGGHDSGTLGVDGIQEKDVVLDVALRVGKLLHDRLGAEIIYTRSDDTFIPLETRTAIANKAQADLFLSIHANSSPDPTARGVEVYYLNFTSDPTALDVAARENAVSGASVHQLSDLVKKITLKDKIAESREFAADVEGSLFAGLTKGNAGLRDRGVKKAPFVVLIGANMPSILAEISFVTNAKDAEQLREPEYRQRVAESLYAGVAKYEGGLAAAKAAPAVKRAALQ